MDDVTLIRAEQFAAAHSCRLTHAGLDWRYYRLGQGPALLWLTGGLRRAALGCDFLTRLAEGHTVLAPDYPPGLRRLDQLEAGLTALLDAAAVDRVSVAGQSYGGLPAQAFLARHPERVTQLLLSSSGPGDLNRAWVLADDLAIALVRLLPQRLVKALLLRQLAGLLPPERRSVEPWLQAARHVVQHDLTREDLTSHFALAADIIRSRAITPGAFANWTGPVTVFRATDDPTQQPADLARYQRLFGREVTAVDLGPVGHVAALTDPLWFADRVAATLDTS
jgi:pimeloyl-ACP methyl ester carboxylesterase